MNDLTIIWSFDTGSAKSITRKLLLLALRELPKRKCHPEFAKPTVSKNVSKVL
jgi:hypothetical protein